MEASLKRSRRTWVQKAAFLVATITLLLLVPRAYCQASLFDPSFQVGGGANGAVNALLVLQNGDILVGGEFTTITGKSNAYLARLKSDGQLDGTFGGGTDGVVNRLFQLPDGRVLVAGAFTNLQGASRHGLGRLLANGSVDLSFDAGTNFDSEEIVRTLCLLSDGKIVTGSEANFRDRFSRFSRFHPDGQLDSSFIRTNIVDGRVYALLPLTNGTILAGGDFQWVGTNSLPEPGLTFLGEDGRSKPNLVSGLTNHPYSADPSTVFSLTQMTNGNILVGGSLIMSRSNWNAAVAQLTPAFQWDTNFVPDSFDFHARSILVQPDGKLVVAGMFYEVGGYWRRHIVRLDATGRVDPCFDPGVGLGGFDGASALALQSDGRILVGGLFDSTDWIGVANLARLLPQGECDAIRTHLFKSRGQMLVLGTCPPGGTNLLQSSTNLVDWETLDTQTSPYVFGISDPTRPGVFYRVKKVF